MVIDISDRRELFVDDYIIENRDTTAIETFHHPIRRELIMTNDQPWEADGWTYYTILRDDMIYRMYYLCMPMFNYEHTKHDPPFHHICYAQSTNGIHWTKPKLGICQFEGSLENNIIAITDTMDAFHVFKDSNPRCPTNERYKAVYTKPGNKLWCMVSEDGIIFKDGWEITSKGKFDSHNTAFWDTERQKYVCHFRDFHDNNGVKIRDIRRIESNDFKNWSEPIPIRYSDTRYDFQMYTNGIQPYYRAPHIYLGFPARYTERTEWTSSYDNLCGSERRKWRMQFHKRYGLALTDSLFMTSRDLMEWNRRNEAFVSPGPESRLNWVYGDGYIGYGLIATRSDIIDEDDEISFFISTNHWSDEPIQVWRYTLRTDGFIGYAAGYEQRKLVTKPMMFSGNSLTINFSTSAAGDCTIGLSNEDGELIPGYLSDPQFGNSIDRKIIFEKPLDALHGKLIRINFFLKDAEVFSFKFSNN